MTRQISYATGGAGSNSRVLPKEIYIKAHKPGYADRSYALDNVRRRGIPSNQTIELDPRDVDRRDRERPRRRMACSAATVIINARAGADDSPDYSYVHKASVTTDAGVAGPTPAATWLEQRVPEGRSPRLRRDRHAAGHTRLPSDVLIWCRKAGTILDEGIAVSGRVLDDRGRPIVGATVGLGADRQIWKANSPSVTTNAEGRFRFGHLLPGTHTLTACSGTRPELADVVVAPDMKPIDFRLGPGHSLRGRVVDRDGCRRRSHHSGHELKERLARLKTKTNAEGRISWDSASLGSVLLTLTKPGYVMVGQCEFVAGKGETQVTMYPPLRVRGKVVDAARPAHSAIYGRDRSRPIDSATRMDGSVRSTGNVADVAGTAKASTRPSIPHPSVACGRRTY